MSTALYTARQQNLGTAGVNVMLKYVDITVKIIMVTKSLPKCTKSRLPLLEQMRCVPKSLLKEADLTEHFVHRCRACAAMMWLNQHISYGQVVKVVLSLKVLLKNTLIEHAILHTTETSIPFLQFCYKL